MGQAVAALWRFPVKSMLGERVPVIEVTDRGLSGDRRYALLDRETGKVASAKTPWTWRELLRCAATASDGGVLIAGPDGSTWHSTDADVHKALSAFVGREVTLADAPPAGAVLERSRPEQVLEEGVAARVDADVVAFGSAAPPGTFFDFAPVHLITTATLRRIAELSPRGTAEVERYRPNLVIDTDQEGFVEHGWIGRSLRIGDRVTLRVVASTPRCAVPTLVHGRLPRDPDALRVLAAHHRVPALPGRAAEPCAGVYAQVVAGGVVREGDEVRLRST